jgi:uncharacterized membrane protein
VTGEAGPQRRRRLLAITLSVVGALASIYLELLHVQIYLGLGGNSYCEVGDQISCTNVAFSGASVLLGVPLPVWGLAGFVALACAAARRSPLLLPLAGFAALASIALFVYELVAIGSICMWCELVHVICFALLALAWLDRRSPKSRLSPKAIAAELGPAAVLVVGTAVFAPAYWMTASWSSGIRLPHGFDEHGRPWLGAEQPDLVIHEYVDYACPHCRIATNRMKIRLANDERLRLVRHHQPRMRCTIDGRPSERCFHARAAICAGEQGLFWEMDDWLFHHASGTAKVDLEQAARDVGLDLEAVQACMQDPDTHARAQADVDEARERGIRGTPGYVVDGRRIEHDELRQLLDR